MTYLYDSISTYGGEVLTVSNTSASFDDLSSTYWQVANTPLPRQAKIYVLSGNIWLRTDGTAPVADTSGVLCRQEAVVDIYGYQDIKNTRMIRDGSADATIYVQWAN